MAPFMLQELRKDCSFLDADKDQSLKYFGKLTLFDRLPFENVYSGFETTYLGNSYAFACGDQFGTDIFVGVSVFDFPLSEDGIDVCLLLHFMPQGFKNSGTSLYKKTPIRFALIL